MFRQCLANYRRPRVAEFDDAPYRRSVVPRGSLPNVKQSFSMYSKDIPPLKTRARALRCGLALLALAATGVTLLQGQTASDLVYYGADGRLQYATTPSGAGAATVPDYSGVGYRNAGVLDLPTASEVPERARVSAGSGNRRQDIIDAINIVRSLPRQYGPEGKYRGAVVFDAGTFDVSDTILIDTDGIILRGAGSDTGGTRIRFTYRAPSSMTEGQIDSQKKRCFDFKGTGTWSYETSSTSSGRRAVQGSYIPVGAKQITVASGHSFSAGDRVVLDYQFNDTWVAAMQMTVAANPTAREPWRDVKLRYEREVVGVSGNVITLDAPVMDPFKPAWGTLHLAKLNQAQDGRLEHVGIEAMRIEAVTSDTSGIRHGWKAVSFENVTQAWARDIVATKFVYSCVSIEDEESSFITIVDCEMLDPVHSNESGERYAFDVNGQRVLVADCFSRGGRHCFVSGSWTAGPVVFTNCTAVNAQSDIGPHQRWSTGHLYDRITTDNEIKVRNRGATTGSQGGSGGSLHGWTGGAVMFWNCTAEEIVVEDPPTETTNWAVGCVADYIGKEPGRPYPEGVIRQAGTPIGQIPSLYAAQLQERLGADAPSFSPSQGVFTSSPTVAITSNPPGATIRYTTNGSTPSGTNGSAYSAPLTLTGTTTLKAVASVGNPPDGPVSTAHYLVGPDAVSVNDAASFVNRALATSQSGVFAVEFDAVPTGNLDNGVIGLSFGSATGYSSIAVAVRFNPNGSIDARNGGAFAAANAINYSQNERYTFRLLVNVPAKTYSAYVTPFGGATQLIGANYAFRTEQSAVASLNTRSVRAQTGTLLVGPSQLIDSQVATPSISPFGGQFSGPQIVTLQSSTSGATIRYTTDGSFPTATSGTVYTGPFTVSTTTTVRAIATSPGLFDSNTATAVFTINDNSYQVTQLNTFHNFPLGNTWTERFEAIFDITPQGSDATVALSNGPSSSYSGLAAIVRFNTSNQIDVRNGGTYAADVAMPFTAGTTYRVRFWVDLPARTYSVFVQPSGGNEVRIANNYAFRTEQATVAALDNLNVETGAQPINVAQRMTQEWPKFWWTTTRTFDGVLPPIVNSTANGNAPQLTVAFWATPAQFAHMGVVDKMPAQGMVGWSVKFRDNGNVWFRVGSNTNRQDVVATALYQPGTPVHFAATFDAGYVRIYRNGLEVAAQSVAYGVNENSVVLQVGKPSSVAVNDVYIGTLRDVRVYETPLTPAQIMTLAQP
jgi:hypothetical protein